MLHFRHLSHRLAAAFCVPLLLTIAAIVLACVLLQRIDKANATMAAQRGHAATVAEWITLVQINLDRAILATRLEAAAGDAGAAGPIAGVQAQLNAAMSSNAVAAQAIQERMEQTGLDAELTRLARNVAQARSAFVALRAQIRDDLLLGEGQARIDAELVPSAQAMEASLARLRQHLALVAAEAAASQSADVRQAQGLLLLTGVLALFVSGGVAWKLARSISRPIADAARFAGAVAQGQIRTPLAVQGSDELGQLQQALLAMRDALGQIVGQLHEGAQNIGHASREVAAGNADLSHRTEQAASRLQQTASAMSQLTGALRQSGDAASQANQLAQSAADVAQRGGSVVAQVVSTMDEISASSRRIADIIGTIDSIAFQTNILALNAAVEAARAGEQGRGFAVVASEVRSLAQRSAGAAREIKTLIGSSVERVNAGSRLVGEAGSTMNEIVASVLRVSDIIGEISNAAAEQSDGISQVNSAIAELDHMTQQNAALVEQSAAAADSLSDQSRHLQAAVDQFDLTT